MSFLDALILGALEGFTEFLPISSTGHLILAEHLLDIPQTSFVKTFTIAIQLGAILAVIFLYGPKLWRSRETLKKVLVGFIPTGIIGFLLYKIIKNYLIGNALIVSLALIIGGIILILLDKFWQFKENQKEVSYKIALLIGACQSLAAIPGVSRSASAIVGGLLAGVEKKTIVEFSFMLAIPTMLMATGYDLWASRSELFAEELGILLFGALVSFVVAIVSIKFLLDFVGKHGFTAFGIYRIAIGSFFLISLTLF